MSLGNWYLAKDKDQIYTLAFKEPPVRAESSWIMQSQERIIDNPKFRFELITWESEPVYVENFDPDNFKLGGTPPNYGR